MLLVDAANVIGSRPTGWWRDRPGAAASLRRPGPRGGRGRVGSPDPVVVVLEGAARGGVEAGTGDGVTVRSMPPGSGDDTLVEVAADSPDQ